MPSDWVTLFKDGSSNIKIGTNVFLQQTLFAIRLLSVFFFFVRFLFFVFFFIMCREPLLVAVFFLTWFEGSPTQNELTGITYENDSVLLHLNNTFFFQNIYICVYIYIKFSLIYGFLAIPQASWGQRTCCIAYHLISGTWIMPET